MTKLTLQNAFQQTFHQQYTFSEFLSIDIDASYKTIALRNATILSPNDKLKDFLKFIKIFIVNYLPYNQECVYSYRTGVGIVECLEPHKNKPYILTMDINHFFSSIEKRAIEELIEKYKGQLPIVQNDMEYYRSRIVEMITHEGKLPVGYPTSPRLSNAVLSEFDDRLSAHCLEHGVAYTRYSDDLIFSSENQETLKKLVHKVQAILHETNGTTFNLNTKKTKFYKRGNKIKILGTVITPAGIITVDKSMKADIEVLFHFYGTDREKYLHTLKSKFDDNEEKVFGVLSYINSIDTKYLTKLRKKYGNYTVDAFLHRSIHE